MIYLFVFVVGAILTYLLVFPIRRLAEKLGVMAYPGGRSIHTTPTPLLGGLAVFFSCIFVSLVMLLSEGTIGELISIEERKLLGLLLGCGWIIAVGIWDDIHSLSASKKILGQLIAVCICIFFGYNIQSVVIPFIGVWEFGPLGSFVFAAWVIAITNAVNLIDGLDGLASLVCFFTAVGNGIIALTMGNTFVAFFSFLLAGNLIGFLIHNFPPAKIFLGDTGSMFLGFLLAVMVIESNTQKRSTTLMILAPLLLLGFSLLDVLLSVVRRFIRGKPIFSSDLGHIHHKLMTRFRNPRRVLFVVGCFSFYMMLISIMIPFEQAIPQVALWIVCGTSVLITALFVRFLGYFRTRKIIEMWHSRATIKFMCALLTYLEYILPRHKNQDAILDELDWTCQALKPLQIVISDSSNCTIYHYKNTPESTPTGYSSFSEHSEHENLQIHWSFSSNEDDPGTSDISILWRAIFTLFSKHWERLHSTKDVFDYVDYDNRPSTILIHENGIFSYPVHLPGPDTNSV